MKGSRRKGAGGGGQEKRPPAIIGRRRGHGEAGSESVEGAGGKAGGQKVRREPGEQESEGKGAEQGVGAQASMVLRRWSGFGGRGSGFGGWGSVVSGRSSQAASDGAGKGQHRVLLPVQSWVAYSMQSVYSRLTAM